MSDHEPEQLENLVEAAIDAHNTLVAFLNGDEAPPAGSSEAAGLASALEVYGVTKCAKCGNVDRRGPGRNMEVDCFYCAARAAFPEEFR